MAGSKGSDVRAVVLARISLVGALTFPAGTVACGAESESAGGVPSPYGTPPGPVLPTGIAATSTAPDGTSPPELAPTETPTLSDRSLSLPVVMSDGYAAPLFGGTLLLLEGEATGHGAKAIASDPDRDLVVVIDVETLTLEHTIALEAGDEPGRLLADSAGYVDVVLRKGGALARIDWDTGELVGRTAVCAAPRGVAEDTEKQRLVVACRGGELVSIDMFTFAPAEAVRLVDDLRDVVVREEDYVISRFRSAELLVIDRDTLALGATLRPELVTPEQGIVDSEGAVSGVPGLHEAHVALGLHALPNGDIVMHNQRANRGRLSGAYYAGFDDCSGGVVSSGVAVLTHGTQTLTSYGRLPSAYAPEIAVSPDGASIATATVHSDGTLLRVGALDALSACEPLFPHDWMQSAKEAADIEPTAPEVYRLAISGDPRSIAIDASGRLFVQLRDPAALHLVGTGSVVFSSDRREHVGHRMFHMTSRLGVACASCHPEGGDDGVTWHFASMGLRRTQVLWGGLLDTAPFHWQGEHADISALMSDTFVSRMGHPEPTPEHAAALARWLDSVRAPQPSPPDSLDVVERGRAAFEKAECQTCHSGPKLTDSKNWDVGSGGEFQTSSLLGLSTRGPYMHTGCATTLDVRFTGCGGTAHGRVELLSESEISDLVGYLESL